MPALTFISGELLKKHGGVQRGSNAKDCRLTRRKRRILWCDWKVTYKEYKLITRAIQLVLYVALLYSRRKFLELNSCEFVSNATYKQGLRDLWMCFVYTQGTRNCNSAQYKQTETSLNIHDQSEFTALHKRGSYITTLWAWSKNFSEQISNQS